MPQCASSREHFDILLFLQIVTSNVDHPKGVNMGKLSLLLIVLVPALSLYMAVIAKVTMPEPVILLLFGTFLVSFANIKFSKEKR